MIANISQRMTIKLYKSNAINHDDIEVYAYGIELLLMMIIDWSITFLLMIFVVKRIVLSIVYFFVFMTLRHQCGGYHAKTHIRCIVLSNLTYMLSVWISMYFSKNNLTWLCVIVEFINFVIIWLFTPVEHENKKVEISQQKWHRKLGIVLNIIYTIAVIGSFLLNKECYGWIILSGQLCVSLSMILQKRKNIKNI